MIQKFRDRKFAKLRRVNFYMNFTDGEFVVFAMYMSCCVERPGETTFIVSAGDLYFFKIFRNSKPPSCRLLARLAPGWVCAVPIVG